MSAELVFDEENGIVNIVYIGTVTLEERKKLADKTSLLYSRLRPLLILVDVRELVMDLTLGEQKAIAKYMASDLKMGHARVAVLHSEGHNPSFLIDAHVVNSGTKLRAQFDNRVEACEWLKGG